MSLKTPWESYKALLLEKRITRIEQVVAKRTEKIHLVVEDIHNPHNVSACLRSAEAFGIQNVHLIYGKEKFKSSSVAKGVSKWLNIHIYKEPEACVDYLKSHNIKIATASPHYNAYQLEDLPCKKEETIALVFGNEHTGVQPIWTDVSDYLFLIPMNGFVESLNISVAAAISLFTITQKAKRVLGEENFYISKEAQKNLLDQWGRALNPIMKTPSGRKLS